MRLSFLKLLPDDRNSVILSFTIQKPPDRKKIDLDSPKPKKKERAKAVDEPKTIQVPKEFKKIAKKFGLPEDHLEFFYEYRASFNWELKKEFIVHCTEPGCKLTVKEAKGCLNEHMISVHDYKDIPCGKIQCSYVAFSPKNLNLHHSRFHGHGQRPGKDAKYSCPFSSCKNIFARSSGLTDHINTHKNIVFSCNFCPFRAVEYWYLLLHLKLHFDIKDVVCDICNRPFTSMSILNMHKYTAHNTDGFDCKHCSFTCSKHHEYKQHLKSCAERLKHSRIL